MNDTALCTSHDMLLLVSHIGVETKYLGVDGANLDFESLAEVRLRQIAGFNTFLYYFNLQSFTNMCAL